MTRTNENIESFFKFYFNKSGCMVPRDLKRERSIIQRNKLEYKLRSTIGTSEEKIWLPKGLKGQNYEIYFNDLAGRSHIEFNGKRIRGVINYQEQALPCIELFTRINSNDFDEKSLTQKVSELANTFSIPNDVFSDIHVAPNSFWQQKNILKHNPEAKEHFYIKNNDSNIGGISVISFEGKKTILPVSSICLKDSHHFHNLHLPFKLQRFYNGDLLERNYNSTVILSDSIQLTSKNQDFINRANKRGPLPMIFLSWFGDKEGADRLDFELLKEREVYFIAMEHSGFLPKDIYKTGLSIKDKLESVEGVNLKFIYYLDQDKPASMPEVFSRNTPIIIDAKTFEKYALDSMAKQVPIEICTTEQKIMSYSPSVIAPLLHPVIDTQSVSYFHGDAEISWLVLSMAFVVSQNQSIFDEWKSPNAFPVLYIHGEKNSFSFGKKLNFLLKTHLTEFYQDKIKLPLGPSKYPESFPIITSNDPQPVNSFIPFLNSFFWLSVPDSSLDISLQQSQDYIDQQLNILMSQGVHPSLLVLDGLTWDKLFPSKKKMERVKSWLTQLQKQGITVWIIPSKGRISTNINKIIQPDNIFRVDKGKANDPSIKDMSIFIEQSTSSVPLTKQHLLVEISPFSKKPSWEVARSRSKYAILEPRLRQLVRLGRNAEEIKDDLGLPSVGMVKRLKHTFNVRTNKKRKAKKKR